MTDRSPDAAGSNTLRLGLRLGAIAVVALGLLPLANLLTDGDSVPWWGAAVWGWIIFGGALVAASLLLALILRERLDRVERAATDALLRPSPRAFGAATSALALVLAAVMSRYAFAGQAYTGDEMAQQWHARVLLAGRMSAVAEPWPEFFNTAPVFDRGGVWFSQYPIGGPALLALGMRLGAAWLVNPVLLALATWATYRFLSRTTEERLARVATLLFVTSPMVLVAGGSQLNHVPALAFGMLALASLARWDADDRALWRPAGAIGLGLGLVALFRPLDAVILSLIIGTFQLWRCQRSLVRRGSLGIQAVAGALPIAVLLWANVSTTGSPLLFAYDALNGAAHGIGFHLDPNGELHTPRRGLAFISAYLMRLGRYLFEWPLPGTLWIAAGLAAAVRVTRWDALLAGIAAAFLLAHGAYWFEGFFAGPRFLFTALPAFVYFAARAPFDLRVRARAPVVRRALLLLVPASVIWTWTGVSGDSTALGRVASYRAQRTKLKTDIEGQIARQSLDHALVFVNESWRGRLLARLRVLGVSQFRAERVLNEVDACALQTALDGDTGQGSPSERASHVVGTARSYGSARLQPGQEADRAIALVAGTQPTATCLAEFLRDTAGTMPYSLFLARQQVGPDGRIGGRVVFARDLGTRNEVLRERFGDRRWYRYRPGRSVDDTMPVFLPYP